MEVTAIEDTTRKILRGFGDDRAEIHVQGREHVLQIAGAAVESFEWLLERIGRGTFPARAATNSACAVRTGLVDFGSRPRDISSRIAVRIRAAWAMVVSVAWVRAGGEFAASTGLLVCTLSLAFVST